ncbi:putative transposase [Oscillibacter valericigenes Sjm18-20]|nr:putative transposase [Oscillibacter valericigenes Sjm18-20]
MLVPDLLLLLSAAKMDGSYMEQRKKLASVPLLIPDDWGLRAFSPEDTQGMMELTELRYGRTTTVIAGQLLHDKWYDMFPAPTLTNAILDRLVHKAYKFNITGESMRKRWTSASLKRHPAGLTPVQTASCGRTTLSPLSVQMFPAHR